MKVQLEPKLLGDKRGIVVQSENEEEAAVIRAMWHRGAQEISYDRKGEITIAPMPKHSHE